MRGFSLPDRRRAPRALSLAAAAGAALIFAVAAPQSSLARADAGGGHAGGGHAGGGHAGGGHSGGGWRGGGGWHNAGGWHGGAGRGGWHRGWGGGGLGWGGYDPDWADDYLGYANPYDYDAGYGAADPYRPPGAAAAGGAYWYYCGNPAGYYPYVQQCSVQWQPVMPQGPG